MKETRIRHEEEILKTRSAGFGGSDAAMVTEIADRIYNGHPLTLTQKRRLRVIAKMDEPQPSVQTSDMIKGHDFEEAQADSLAGFKAERLMTWDGEPFKHFTVFAHADFFNPTTYEVVECKWTRTRTPEELVYEYKWQLQWYYMLGAIRVTLRAGIESDGNVSVGDIPIAECESDVLVRSLRLIDEQWDFIVANMLEIDETECGQLPPDIAKAVKDMEWLKEEISTREAKYKELQAQVRLYMEQRNVQKIGGERYTLIYTPATETVKFNTNGLQKTYPKIYEQFVSYTLRSAYVTLKARKEGER